MDLECRHGETLNDSIPKFGTGSLGSNFQQEQSEGNLDVGPTVEDSDVALASQNSGIFGPDLGYELLDWQLADDPGDTVMDTCSGSQIGNVEGAWSASQLDGCRSSEIDPATGRLGPDLQLPASGSKPSLPGFGVDHSKWTLVTEPPKFFWETDPFFVRHFWRKQLQRS